MNFKQRKSGSKEKKRAKGILVLNMLMPSECFLICLQMKKTFLEFNVLLCVLS